jgi:hypothetical protein
MSDKAAALNRAGYNYAKRLIADGSYILDARDDWSEHNPTASKENEYIKQHGIRAYGRWHLGIDPSQDENNKGRYKFPYGDFERVHRCAVLSAESRAGQYKYTDIEQAAAHIHGMLDALK